MATGERVLERGRGGRQLAIAGVLVILAVVAWFLFLRGGGDAVEETHAVSGITDEVVAQEAEGEVFERSSGTVETFEVFAPKDPFKPLLSEASSAADGQGSDEDDSLTDAADPTSGGGSAGQNVDGHIVKLVDVFERDGALLAQVQVDSTVYTVEEGETFAENFQLLSISGECASMLFGDDQFTLCEGEEILK